MWMPVSDGIDALTAGKLDASLPLATKKRAYNLLAPAARPSLNGTRNSVFSYVLDEIRTGMRWISAFIAFPFTVISATAV